MRKSHSQVCPQQTRRRFLQATGASAGCLAMAGSRFTPAATAAEEGPGQGTSKRQLPFKLGLASYSLRKFPLDEALAMTQRVALEYICLKSFHLPLESTPGEIAEAAAKVKAAGIVLYGGGVIRMADQAQVNQAFDYAKAAGMTTIVGVPMPDVLELVNEKVKQYDIKVAIHNHGPGDKVYPTPESAYQRIDKLDPRIGLCIDIGHTARIGADPKLDAKRFADRLLDVHIKDVSAAAKEGETVEIGRGVIDIPGFLRTLIAISYSGVVALEYEKDPEDPLVGLAESVGYVKGSLATI